MKDRWLDFWLSEQLEKIIHVSLFHFALWFPVITMLGPFGLDNPDNWLMHWIVDMALVVSAAFYGICCIMSLGKMTVLLWYAPEVSARKAYGADGLRKEFMRCIWPLLPLTLELLIIRFLAGGLDHLPKVWFELLWERVLMQGGRG